MKKNGLYLKQNTVTPGLRGGPKAGDEGARRIAMHYKFSLDHAFERRPDVRQSRAHCASTRSSRLLV